MEREEEKKATVCPTQLESEEKSKGRVLFILRVNFESVYDQST